MEWELPQLLEVEISATLEAPTPTSSNSRKTFGQLIRTDPLSTIVSVSIDVLSATIAVILAWWWALTSILLHPPMWCFAVFVPLVVIVMGARSLYRRSLNRRFLDEFYGILSSGSIAAMLLLCALVLFGIADRPGAAVTKLWVCASVLIPFGRLIRVVLQRRLQRRSRLVSPTLVIGSGQVTQHVIARMIAAPEHGMNPVGVLSDETHISSDQGAEADQVPYLGTVDRLEAVIAETQAERLVIAFTKVHGELLTGSVRIAHRHGLRVWVVPRMYEVIGSKSLIDHIGGMPLLSVPHTNPRGWQFRVKHVSDRIAAGCILFALSPLFLTLMLLVRWSSPGPIFFAQERVGRNGQIFGCLKFRSMRLPDPDHVTFVPKIGSAPGGVEGTDRRTRIGKLMRSTSMDELPQLLNVLRGDMSLVGPRPERPEFVTLFEAQIRRYGERHRVKAGVTGWAQVNGLRGQTSIADRAEWDNYYIENWSLWLDIKILMLTVLAVFKQAE
ncbi:sugar transferase [Rhodococcus sp. D-46]|uniref:sugar transferase n=1 Tax=unclassified Rhodococcus (in: high G+C Gram-positive bacteria) TaxID=192944 RepID=UPI0009FA3196|nr:sugar transferase [Rhodococcus sp. ADH]NHE68846.1 sugar transferase [Rhodococcus sp. D-46]